MSDLNKSGSVKDAMRFSRAGKERWGVETGHVHNHVDALADEVDDLHNRIREQVKVIQDAKNLLTNYLASGNIPEGSDLETLRDRLSEIVKDFEEDENTERAI